MSAPVRVCVICRFEAQIDDVLVPTESGHCICLVCWRRETDGDQHPMPRNLRRMLDDALKDVFASDWWDKR